MIFDSIVELPPVLAAAFFVVVTVALAFASYGGARWLFTDHSDADQRDLANSVVFRISALHGLILALVFAQELVNSRDVSMAAAREAVMIGDVFYDLERYGGPDIVPIQTDIARYVRTVLDEEWDSLSRDNSLADSAWAHWSAAYEGILNLTPQSPKQGMLRDFAIEHVREISGLRRSREIAAITDVQGLFLTAAILGVVLTAAGYFTYAPTTRRLAMIGLFASYTGLIIFFIVAFANPYHRPGKVEPVAFQQIYDANLRAAAEASP